MENVVTDANASTDVVQAAAAASVYEPGFSYPVEISIKTLLAAGAHYGHQTERWNPKMLPYIYCARNHIHIINLDISMQQWRAARKFVVDTVSRGGNVLFVGTKLQARDAVKAEAERSKAFYVNTRWLGGTLSNFQTIKNSIERLRNLEDLLAKASDDLSKVRLTKKEKLQITREIEKLERSLGGIRDMKKLPDVVFVVDVIKEHIAVAEARRLHIPVIALVDTNTDPECVEFPIASNDDAARTLRMMLAGVADAVIEGRSIYEMQRPKEIAAQRDVVVGQQKRDAEQAPAA